MTEPKEFDRSLMVLAKRLDDMAITLDDLRRDAEAARVAAAGAASRVRFVAEDRRWVAGQVPDGQE